MLSTQCGWHNIQGGASGAALLSFYGPTLIVDIGFDVNYTAGKGIPIPGLKGIQALVDTGASESCIDNLLATALNLPIVDRRPISGVAGAQEANMYLAQVHIPSLSYTIYGEFAGVHLQAGGQIHAALIGRSFLRKHIMFYNGETGEVTLSRTS